MPNQNFPSWVSTTPITDTTPIPVTNTSDEWAYVNWQSFKTYLDNYYYLKSQSYRRDLKKAPTLAFESMDSGWTNWYGWATAIHDSTIKHLWAASIQLPCPTAWTSVGMRKNITDIPLDINVWFEFWVRSDAWANVTALEILLGNTGMTPNYWLFDLKTVVSSDTIENNTWLSFTISKADFTIQTGSLNWDNTQDMIVRARSTPWTTPTVWIDSFRIFYEGYSSAVWELSTGVLFCADDWWSDQMNLLDIAESYGQKVCLFIIPEAIGTGGYLTQSQVDDIHDRGHIIAMHWAIPLTSLTWTALTDEIAEIVAYRNAHPEYRGWHMFALPEWKMNTEAEEAINPYFKYIFSIDEMKAYPILNETVRIPRRSLLNTTAPAVVTGLMNATLNGKWIQIINFHHVITTPVIITDYSIANTTTIFDYTLTAYIPVLDWLTLFPR